MKSKALQGEVMKKILERISKSIQFPAQVIAELETLAKDLGMTRLRNGKEEGDISKIVNRAVSYMLADTDKFKSWMIGNSSNGRKHKVVVAKEKEAVKEAE
jgi:hypothetical protein